MAKIMMRDLSPELTDKEKKELDSLEGRDIVYDDESPRMTEKELSEFHRFDQIPITVSDNDMRKVRSLKGEPRLILSKLLTMAINDPEMIRKCQV